MSEAEGRDLAVRCATAADANAIGQLLHDFNREYDEPTPGPSVLAERIGRLLGAAGTVVLVGGSGPDGLAVLRFRPEIWTGGIGVLFPGRLRRFGVTRGAQLLPKILILSQRLEFMFSNTRRGLPGWPRQVTLCQASGAASRCDPDHDKIGLQRCQRPIRP